MTMLHQLQFASLLTFQLGDEQKKMLAVYVCQLIHSYQMNNVTLKNNLINNVFLKVCLIAFLFREILSLKGVACFFSMLLIQPEMQ